MIPKHNIVITGVSAPVSLALFQISYGGHVTSKIRIEDYVINELLLLIDYILCKLNLQTNNFLTKINDKNRLR